MIEESTLIIIKNSTKEANRKSRRKGAAQLLRNYERTRYDETISVKILYFLIISIEKTWKKLQRLENKYNDFWIDYEDFEILSFY